MALPVNISELIHGRVVEWERLEFNTFLVFAIFRYIPLQYEQAFNVFIEQD